MKNSTFSENSLDICIPSLNSKVEKNFSEYGVNLSIPRTVFLLTLLTMTFLPLPAQEHGGDWPTFLEHSGDVTMYSLPVIAGVTTILLEENRDGTWQWAKSLGTSLALTTSLKYIIDKPRPAGNPDGLAFPSGHTSTAFNSAAFLQKRYGWKYGVPAYALAGYVAYSRLEGVDRSHDGWDVLAGAVVGVGSAYLFTRPLDSGADLSLSPRGNGLLFTYRF